MSRLCLNSTPHASLSPAFSSLSFDFSSPSASSSSPSDSSALSTPLTIAPSALSSPVSEWDSPQLQTISESHMEETAEDTLPMDSMDLSAASLPGSDRELTPDTPSKRKRSPKAKQTPSAGEAVPEKTRSRRASRALTSPKTVAPTSPRVRKIVSKAITPASPASKRAVCPLPARTGRSRSSSTSSTSSAVSSSTTSRTSRSSAPKTKRPLAAQLTIRRVTHAACCESESEHEHDILESDDSGSEYEADPSELEFDELDDEDEDDDYDDYRPAKRTRSLSSSTRAASLASSVTAAPVRRKAASPKIASDKKKASKKKKSSAWSVGGGKKKKSKAKPEGPPPTCVWCDKEFTRESDVLRHEQRSCKLYPFDRVIEYCPLCRKEISRNDAVIRHRSSGDCKKRQRELREQGLLPSKVAKAKTEASARAAKKAVNATLSPRRRASRALSA